jgi:hypothetical protein
LPVTCTVASDTLAELIDVLNLLQDHSRAAGRSIDVEYRLTGIGITLGPRAAEPAKPAGLQLLITADASAATEEFVTDTRGADNEPDPPPASEPEPADNELDHECVGCEHRFATRRAVSNHVRDHHWNDVRTSWRERGNAGIQSDWGIAASAARKWGRELEAEDRLASHAAPAGGIPPNPNVAERRSPPPGPPQPPVKPPGPVFPTAGPIARLPVNEAAARGGAADAL